MADIADSTGIATQAGSAEASRRAGREARIRRSSRSLQWWQPLAVFVVLIGLWYGAAAYYASQVKVFAGVDTPAPAVTSLMLTI